MDYDHESSRIHDEAEPERLTIAQIFGLVASGWRVIASLTIVFVIVALLVSAISTGQYRTYYVAMPAPTANDPLRQTGLSLDVLGRQAKTPDWEMYISLMTSTTLAQRLVTKTPILQRLYAADWDAKKKRWITEQNFGSLSLGGKVKWLLGYRTKKAAPDKFALQGYLAGFLSVQPKPDTSQYIVSIDSPDPETSLLLLTDLHQAANDIVREARLSRAIGQRTHLLAELNTTTVADYRQTLLDILGRVETSVMTASVGGQYAGVLLDGPVTSPGPVFPVPALFVKLAVISGVLFGLILVIFFPVNDDKLLAAWRGLRGAVQRRIRAAR